MADMIKISEEIEVSWDAGKGLAPMDEVGDNGARVWIDMDWVETIETNTTNI